MAKRKRTRRAGDGDVCAYCSRKVVDTEREHVFPRAWYPHAHVGAKLKVPSCGPCNRELGRVEDRLFFPLMASVPLGPRTRDVFMRARAGFDPQQGESVREVSFRGAREARIRRDVRVVGPGDDSHEELWTPTLPNKMGQVTTPAGLLVRGATAIRYRTADLSALSTKLVRGCFFLQTGRALPEDVPVNAGGFTADPRDMVAEAMENGLEVHGAFPFRYGLIGSPDRIHTIWFFHLWGHHWLQGTTGVHAGQPPE